MKKVSAMFLALLIMLGTITPVAASPDSAPFVYMSGKKLSFTNQVTVQNGITFIELRKVFELLDIKLTYTPATMEITGVKKDFTLITKVGSDLVYVNGEKFTMPARSYAKNGRTMIPLRFLSEHMGLKVDWIQEIHSIVISGKELRADFTFTKEEVTKDLLEQFKAGRLGSFPIGIMNQHDAEYFFLLGAPLSVNTEDRYYSYGDYRLYYEMVRYGNIYIKELRVYPKTDEEINLKQVRETLGKPHKIYEDQKSGTTVYIWNDTKHSVSFYFKDANNLHYISVK